MGNSVIYQELVMEDNKFMFYQDVVVYGPHRKHFETIQDMHEREVDQEIDPDMAQEHKITLDMAEKQGMHHEDISLLHPTHTRTKTVISTPEELSKYLDPINTILTSKQLEDLHNKIKNGTQPSPDDLYLRKNVEKHQRKNQEPPYNPKKLIDIPDIYGEKK
jgi:hypothetical protein